MTYQIQNYVNEKELDRVAWYVYKFSMSVGCFKENPTQANFDRLMLTLDQVEERLDVDPSQIREIAIEYMKNPSKELRIRLNEATKELIKQILRKHIMGVG